MKREFKWVVDVNGKTYILEKEDLRILKKSKTYFRVKYVAYLGTTRMRAFKC